MHQFFNQTKKISKNKINLKDFYSFYEKEICPYKYIYTTDSKGKIEIIFEKNNFPHLLGLHKFNKVKSLGKTSQVILEIETERLTAKILKEAEPSTYNKPEVMDRLLFFPTLKTILEKAEEIISFDQTKCIPTVLEADFFIYSEEIKVKVYLAVRNIDKDKNRIICTPVSFLVDRINKYQKENQEHLKIQKIENIERS